MSNEIVCPNCGRDDDLTGQAHDGLIRITCSACNLEWDRDPSPHCPTCASPNVQPVPHAVWEKSRGTQLSLVALRTLYLCPECDADALRRYRESGTPVPPKDNPATGTR